MMLRDLLWIYEAKLQYERQKAQGMAGFIALLTVFLLMWKWNDWFYPLLDKLGFVSLTAKMGLRHESPVITIAMIVTVLLAIALTFALLALIGVLLQSLCLMIGFSKAGTYIFAILAFPMVVWVMCFRSKTKKHSYVQQYKQDPVLKDTLKATAHMESNEQKLHLYLQQLERKALLPVPQDNRKFTDAAELLIDYDGHWTNMDNEYRLSGFETILWDTDFVSQSFTVEEARRFLNRVPASEEDINWLLGYNAVDKQIYALLPNPLPHPFSKGAEADLSQGLKNYWTVKNLDSIAVYNVISIPLMTEWNKKEFVLKMNTHEQIDRDTLKYTNINDYSSIFLVHSNFLKPLFHGIQRDTNVKLKLRTMITAHYVFPEFLKNYQWNESLNNQLAKFEEVTNCITNYYVHYRNVYNHMKYLAANGVDYAIDWMKEEQKLEG